MIITVVIFEIVHSLYTVSNGTILLLNSVSFMTFWAPKGMQGWQKSVYSQGTPLVICFLFLVMTSYHHVDRGSCLWRVICAWRTRWPVELWFTSDGAPCCTYQLPKPHHIIVDSRDGKVLLSTLCWVRSGLWSWKMARSALQRLAGNCYWMCLCMDEKRVGRREISKSLAFSSGIKTACLLEVPWSIQ